MVYFWKKAKILTNLFLSKCIAISSVKLNDFTELFELQNSCMDMADCKANPHIFRPKRPTSFKMVFITSPLLEADLLFNINYAERFKTGTFGF